MPNKSEIIVGRSIFDENMQKIAKRDYCVDINKTYKPNVVGDVADLPFKDESVDGIICHAVLEHVPEPQRAVEEMYRILKKGGEISLYVPFLYPYHPDPKDYYRFTEDAILYMFRYFDTVKIQLGESYVATTLRFIAGFRYHLERIFLFFRKPLEWLSEKIHLVRLEIFRKSTTGYVIYAKK